MSGAGRKRRKLSPERARFIALIERKVKVLASLAKGSAGAEQYDYARNVLTALRDDLFQELDLEETPEKTG